MSTGAKAFADALVQEGVQTVFGLSGHGNLALLDALLDTDIRFIDVHHEQIAAHAADAYYRVTRRPGVVLTSVGPGATNTLTALLDAALDCSAVVLICGDVPQAYVGKGPLQEVNLHGDAQQVDLFAPAVKRCFRVEKADLIPDVIARAFNYALCGVPGPVVIDVPMDLFARDIHVEPSNVYRRPQKSARVRGDLAELQRAAELLARAQHPLILAGGGVVLAGAERELREVAEALSAPVATTLIAHGAFPSNHPLAVGFTGVVGTPPANMLAQEADVILAVGTRLSDMDASSWQPDYFFRVPPGQLIHVDLDPHEIGKVYPTAVGIVGDAKVVLAEMAALLRASAEGLGEAGNRNLPTISAALAEWRAKRSMVTDLSELPLEPAAVVSAARKALPEDGILIAGIGVRHVIAQHFDLEPTGRMLVGSGYGTMGIELPAALGAKVGAPDRAVLALVGDGALNSTISTLATAAAHSVAAVWVVLNNGGYASIALYQAKHFGRFVGTYFQTSEQKPYCPDYVALARAYGLSAVRLGEGDSLVEVLHTALRAGVPYLVDVPVTPHAHVQATGNWAVNGILAREKEWR